MSTTVKQRANVYTTMLAISFICLVIANVFLYYEQERYQGGMKVESDLRASSARQLAEAKKNAPPEPDPMEMMPMEPDPNAPMPEPDPNAPAPDPNAPAPDPNAPAPDPAAMPADPNAPPAAAMPAEPNM